VIGATSLVIGVGLLKVKHQRGVSASFASKASPILAFCLCLFGAGCPAEALSNTPETVQFDSANKDVKLTAYLYRPDAKQWPGRRPAIVLLHGRSGVFSSSAKRFDATTLSSRTMLWGKFWAERGYIGLYVDSFAPRGHAKGFEAGTNKAGLRPTEVNEITVRPHDAMQGLKYLRSLPDVDGRNVFLQGWSNGGSATLSTMHQKTLAMDKPDRDAGFRAAIAVYPACRGVARHYGEPYRTYAPLLLLIGTEDEEVSFSQCEAFAQRAREGDVTFVRYEGATHSYDTPTAKRKGVDANVQATEDTMKRAEAFFRAHFVQGGVQSR
jgi:carboxymethylenebutenolidase